MFSLHTAALLLVTTELFPLVINAPGEGLPKNKQALKNAV